MKKLYKSLLILLFTFATATMFSQAPPPPPPPSHGTTGNTNGANAPIGSGLFILLGLGAAYGGNKLYQIRKQMIKEEL